MFTFPAGLRPFLGAGQIAAALVRLSHELDGWARYTFGVRLGAWAILHPAGGRSPLAWGPHVHAVIPLVGLDLAGAVVHLDRPASEALACAKARWGLFLAQVASTVGVSDRPPNVHATHHDTPASTRRALTYAATSWPDWHAGDLPAKLASPRRWGLAANNPRAAGIEGWREAVAGPPVERRTCSCPDCGGPAEVLGTVPAASRDWPAIADLPLTDWRTLTRPAA